MTKNLIQQQTDAPALQTNALSTLRSTIERMKPAIAAALPSVITPERFTRIAMSAVSATPKLAECNPQSFLASMMTAAQLGLEPNTPLGQAYLLPYWNSKKSAYYVQFQLGYKGLIDLAYRSGEVSIIQAQIVYANDEFEYSFGLEPTLRHVPAKSDRGDMVYVYAMFKTKDGGSGYDVMSVEEVRAHAKKFSKSAESGPWVTNFEEMAKKTVLKRVLKYAPLKSDFVRAATQDGTIKEDIAKDMGEVDAIYVEPDEISEAPEVSSPNPETGEVV